VFGLKIFFEKTNYSGKRESAMGNSERSLPLFPIDGAIAARQAQKMRILNDHLAFITSDSCEYFTTNRVAPTTTTTGKIIKR